MDKVTLLRKMIDSDAENGELWFLLGLEYISSADKNQAMIAFSEALKYCDDKMKHQISDELIKMATGTPDKPVAELIVSTHSETEEVEEEQEDKVIPFSVLHGENRSGERKVITFQDVGGLDALKDTIRMRIIKPFTNQGLFDRFKKKIGGGLLLYGPPGCGKTFIAKATAGECRANFFPVHITDILNKYIGESEQNIKEIFSIARAKKPSILFFDEIDTIGFNRAKLSSEYMRSVIDQLLTEIDGIEANTDKLLIIGATNMPWDVDAALKRPGRFDKAIFVQPPDEKAREIIFQLKLEGRPCNEVDYALLARQTALYSGADIENVVETATEEVLKEIMSTGVERAISMNDLLNAIRVTRPSTIEWFKTIKNYVKYANQAGLYDDVETFLKAHKI